MESRVERAQINRDELEKTLNKAKKLMSNMFQDDCFSEVNRHTLWRCRGEIAKMEQMAKRININKKYK